MKILLMTIPPDPESVSVYSFVGFSEPLALEYIGAGVQEDHDVRLLDFRVERDTDFKQVLETFQPDVIGCGACTIDVSPVKKVYAEAKRILPNVLTVVGGVHATMIPQDFYDENIDVVIVGEGVFPFKELCRRHEQGESFEGIDNVHFRKNGSMAANKKIDHPPLDQLPLPARNLTQNVRHMYNVPFTKGDPAFATIRGSVGCVYRCHYCSINTIMNYKLLTRDIDAIVDELSQIKESIIFWADDELFLKHKRAVQLAREITSARLGKTHRFYARADHIYKRPECIEEWAKAGMEMVMIGFESHRDSDLKKLGKGSNIGINDEVVRICQANNIKVRGNFIIQPDFSKDDFKGLAAYSRKLGVDFPSFSVLTPFPGTPLYNDIKDTLAYNNYNLFDGIHTLMDTTLTLKQFYKEVSRINARSITFRNKLKLMKEIDPRWKKQFMGYIKQSTARIQEAYKDHN